MNITRRFVQPGMFLAAFLLSAFVLSTSTAHSVHAAPLDCEEVREILAHDGEFIRQTLDDEIAGYEHRINSRKRLVIHGIASVENGHGDCEIKVVADVTIKRKWRRDAHGTVTLHARVDVDQVEPNTIEIVFTDVRVTDVLLSHLTEIGEAFYRWVGNIILPDSKTVRVSF
jgi:hypothetical protein